MKKNKFSVSYAITACNEYDELKRLLNDLRPLLNDSQDELVVQLDMNTHTAAVSELLIQYESNCRHDMKIVSFPLNGNFAQFKNNLKSHCTKSYVFQIDADEYLGDGLLLNLKSLLSENSDVDLFAIPRINLVLGVTEEYAKSQGWKLQEIDFPVVKEYGNVPVINYPDSQLRLFKNKSEIKWIRPVHEYITGHKTYSNLSFDLDAHVDLEAVQEWSIIHIKQMGKQVAQNKFYESLMQTNG